MSYYFGWGEPQAVTAVILTPFLSGQHCLRWSTFKGTPDSLPGFCGGAGLLFAWPVKEAAIPASIVKVRKE